jgi:hypothetical protein
MAKREPLLWRFRWWRECRRRKAEEFRLYRLQHITGDEDDRRAWKELQEENHALGVW